MTKRVAIITDSTAYIPAEQLQGLDVHIAPQVLIWGEKTYLDGVDIQPEEFYARLSTAQVMPSTSQVSPKSMRDLYERLHGEGFDILAILLSEKLSGTIASAIQALEAVPEARVEIVDSRTTAMALGFQALLVARAAAEGADLETCAALARQARDHTGVIFAVDTLEFLHRGGRIGGGARFFGTALNIKPILEVQDGVVEGVERVRTRKKSLARLIELVEQRVSGRKPLRLATLHANAQEEAHQLLKEAAELLQAEETVFSEVSPVVGTHTGPGTIGLAYMAGM